jgi:TonB family protein
MILSSLSFYSGIWAQPEKKVTGFAGLEKKIEKNHLEKIKKDLNKKLSILKTKNPLFIVNGVHYTNLKSVDAASIDSIQLIKPEIAISLYGKEGKKGALVITTREKLKFEAFGKNDKTDIAVPDYTVKKDTPWPDEQPVASKPNMEPDPEKIYTKTEIEPKFIGNLKDFLNKNLKYPDDASNNGIQGKVIIDFVVTKKGNIYDLRLSSNSPVKQPSLVMEAIRLLKKSNGQWKPAIQNGSEVSAYSQQEFLFILPDEK